jgi:hypothetical protein
MAVLDVWIARRGAACGVDDHSWLVTVYDPHNGVFEWAGNIYQNLPAPHAHWSGKLPPGTYVIQAVSTDTKEHTDHAIVAVECNDAECIRLYISDKDAAPPSNRCEIHIKDAMGILGDPKSHTATSVRVTGTAAGCKKIQVVVNCVSGKGQVTAAVGTGGDWQADVPLKPGCRCGGKSHVIASCSDNPKCSDEFKQDELRCTKAAENRG